MNIGNFSTQTRLSLKQMDLNQDQKLNARELQSFANQASVPGIAQADLLLIQAELKAAQSAEQTIVSFVDPVLSLASTIDPAISASVNPFLKPVVLTDKKATLVAEPLPVKFSFTPDKPKDSLNAESIAAGEVKAVSDLGPLQVTGSSRFKDNAYQGSKLNATLKASPKLEFNANLEAPATPEGQNGPVKMDLGAQSQWGKLKVSARSNFDESGLSKSAMKTDLEVFSGHHLLTETSLTDQGLGVAKVTSSHQLFKSLSLDGGLEIDPETGHLPRQNLGLSYAAGPDSVLAGVKIRTEARRNAEGFETAKISTTKSLKAGLNLKGSLEFDANGSQKQGLGFSYSAAPDSVLAGLSLSAEAEAQSGKAASWQQPALNLKMGYSIKF